MECITDKGAVDRFVKAAPQLRSQDYEEINGCFRHFIFRVARTGEYWTTCCRKHMPPFREREEKILRLAQNDTGDVPTEPTAAERFIMSVEHTPEPEISWGHIRNRSKSEKRYKCPLCEAEVTVKELGSTGRRKNLWSFRRGITLRWWRGALWAVAWDASKSYLADKPTMQTGKLTMLPDVHTLGYYRFRPGKAEFTANRWYCYNAPWTSMNVQKEPGKKEPSEVSSPFGWSNDYGMGFEVCARDELSKSPFRYIRIAELFRRCDPVRLLTTACFYPVQLEMLHKIGLDEVIGDLVDQGKKNAWLIDWKATDRKKFMKISPSFAAAHSDNLEGLRVWVALGQKDDMDVCKRLTQHMDTKNLLAVTAKMKKYDLRVNKLLTYAEGFTVPASKKKGAVTIRTVLELIKDYWDAAQGVGLDLNNRIFLLPKDLHGKHDEVCAAWTALCVERRNREAAERDRKAAEAYQKRKEALEKKYAFAFDGLEIQVPSGAEAIVAEGKNLRHCVGGYADRHVKGRTTILFLRRSSAPDRSLVTIEMDVGNNADRLRQIHGYDDDRTACPDNPNRIPPEKLYKDFLGVWLDWIKAGSKRDKKGAPRLPNNDKENAA